MTGKTVKGLLGVALAAAGIFTLHMLNGVVVSIYEVEAGTAGVLTSLMTVGEVIILAVVSDLQVEVKVEEKKTEE